MIQKIYIPSDLKLSQIVNFITYVEFTSEDIFEGWTAIFPNATSNLMISLHENININQTLNDSSIYASCTGTAAILPYVGLKFMTVQFNSYGMYYIKRIPASELYDTLFPLDLFFKPGEIDRITSQLKESSSFDEKFKALELFLSKQIDIPDIDPRLPFIIASLKSQEHSRIDDLTETIGLSGRGLQKLFKKYVGFSPVYFKKIVRFNHAANLILSSPETPLTGIAYECGYYDQAHFIKDFKEFGGITPSEFLHLQAKSSDFYNFTLKDIDSFGD